jgi:hypothetical protein
MSYGIASCDPEMLAHALQALSSQRTHTCLPQGRRTRAAAEFAGCARAAITQI